jgi:hypothetical protein
MQAQENAMSRYALIIQVFMAVLSGVMSLIMGVVLLTYAVYLDADPRLARDLPFLVAMGAWFLAAAVAFGLGSRAYWRDRPWRWVWWLPQGGILWALLDLIRSLQDIGS